MANELELIQPQFFNAVTVFSTPNGIEAVLKGIKEKAMSQYKPDISTASGRKEIASLAYKVSQCKTLIDGAGKDLISDQKKAIAKTDGDRKLARDYLDELKIKIRQPLTDWEQAEEDRKKKEADEAQHQTDWDSAIQENELFDAKKEIEKRNAEDAERKRIEDQKEAERLRIEREKQIAENAKAKAEEAAKEAAARAEQTATKKLEDERLESQRKADEAEKKRLADIKAAQDKAEAEKQAIIRAQQEKERLEAERIAKQKADDEKRIANLQHRKNINDEIIKDFISIGIDCETAERMIEAIDMELIRNITINY